jgi:hypothetical protein
MISNIHRNNMGTVSFDAKFKGMRKAQEFIIYPVGPKDDPEILKIQSDTRIGFIGMLTGMVSLCPPVSSGAYNHHLSLVKPVEILHADDLHAIKRHVFTSAGPAVGNNGMVVTDNSGALNIFNTKEGK